MSRRSRGANYQFRGRALAVSATTLAQAFADLEDVWRSRPSLVMHDWGAVRMSVTISGVRAEFDVTDPAVLQAASEGNMDAVIAWLSQQSGLPPEEARIVFERASDVSLAVDKIQPATKKIDWRPEAGYSPDVLKDVVGEWSAQISKELQREVARTPSREAEQNARRMTEIVVRTGLAAGKSIPQIAQESGLSQTTLRDANARNARRARGSFARRTPGTRTTPEQQEQLVALYRQVGGNAAEVERRTGVPARTIRGIVSRYDATTPTAAAPTSAPAPAPAPAPTATTPAPARGRQPRAARAAPARTEMRSITPERKEQLREELIARVEAGASASQAGRELGVSERTARRWMQKAKEF